ncbi:WD40 repeat domain-containing protein [Micromonospora chokoriensis]|uniref:WD40-like Beta Propeller Repeat n=1 Tax=Micromonospora chokoriensis TaxID=356851 RepID=A0A1C4WRQ6_9ACTN|nr:hypothetical protein [Micromonospora chokoriensis]SCE98829.1 hypothetical protein GA0070612_2756 [Micromonospora chokoriensis]
MTDRLRDALRSAAEDVPSYRVYERALATARRDRLRRVGAGVAASVLLAVAGVVVPLTRTPGVDPAATANAALPDHIALPPLGTLHVTDRPRLGPASVVFDGPAPRLHGWNDVNIVGVVGADSDRYRIMRIGGEALAGRTVHLSPDGRYLARPDGAQDDPPGVEVVDLVTGRTQRLASPVDRSVWSTPVGWSADGGSLVVSDEVPVAFDGATYTTVLSAVTVAGERWTRLAAGAQEANVGSTVAAAPGRIAYQYGRTVAVTDLTGRELSSFALPDETWLAGKGAWRPDGTNLTLATRGADTGWTLRQVDPTSGRDVGPLRLPAVSGAVAVRLLGWAPDGSALVAAYLPDPAAPDLPLEEQSNPPMSDQRLRTVRVLALTPGATAPRTVLTAPDQVIAVDVADQVIRNGRVRDAQPPGGVGGRFWFWTGLLTVLVTVGLLYVSRQRIALWRDDRRVRRARRTGG